MPDPAGAPDDDLPLQARSAAADAISRSPRILLAFVLVFLGLALVQAASFQNPRLLRDQVSITDYNAFHVAGQMAREGRAAETYDWRTMQAEQHRRTGDESFMPWAYPPPFTAAMALLAGLPIGLSYLVFLLPGLILFWIVLRRLAGPYLPAALAVCFPALVVNLRCGQNGFYTAAFIGGVLLLLREGRRGAGVPLGLMVIKPHLAVAASLLALLQRRWTVLATAAATALVAAAAATAMLGVEVWPAFLRGTKASTGYLWQGLFPLHRMTSAYAALARLGLPPAAAMAAHAGIALATLALLVRAWRLAIPRDWLLAATAIATVFVSPYNYDYDLPVVAMAAALVWPDLLRRASGREMAAISVLSALASCNMLYHTVYSSKDSPLWREYPPISFSPFLLLAALWLCVRVLRRPPAGAGSPA